MKTDAVMMALAATIFTWLMTALGAATVIFFKRINNHILNILLGFAAGVMIAASYWSLLEPAIDRANRYLQTPAWLVVTSGFLGGAAFIWMCNKTVTYFQKKTETGGKEIAGQRFRRIMMLILAITLHNIPEGLAVGVAFGALKSGGFTPEGLTAAVSVAVGIGLQNFPEGAAVSIPLRREGCSRRKSFFYGQASGLVEPVAGVLGALLVMYMETLLPFTLAFAAGAMILVAVHELIPECQHGREIHPYGATMGIMAGFSSMMLLEVLLR